MKSEYDLSLNAAQMAAKWARIKKEKDTFLILQYDAVMDDRTTTNCFNFNSVTLRWDHWFWKQYYPPNHFGCRSTVRQLTHGKDTNLDEIIFPDIPKIFQPNLAENGLLYPKDHPYFNGYDGSNDLKLLRTETQLNAKYKYEKKTIEIDGTPVTITWQGIKEIGNQPHRYKEKQLQLLNVLPNIMKEFHIIEGNEKFKYPAINGMPNFYLNIKWDSQKMFWLLHSITDSIK